MKRIVIFSGAGISAESGFSTFRDNGGLWDKYPIEEVATPEAFKKNPNKIGYIYVLTPSGIKKKTELTVNFMKRKMKEYDDLKKEIERK